MKNVKYKMDEVYSRSYRYLFPFSCSRRNQHGVNIAAIIRMKERFEHGMTVEKIINSERKLDADKPGHETVIRKGTGTDHRNPSPRPQSLSKERSPQELDTRRTENCEVTSGEKTTSKLEVSEKISSLQVMEDQSSSEAKEEQLRNSSEKCVNQDEKSVTDSKNGDREEICSQSGVNERDIGKLKEGADCSVTVEYDVNSSPKPQRVQRTRERRTPNRQQRINTEQSALDSEHEREHFPSCDNRDKPDLHEMPSQGDASEERSPVNRVETVSRPVSLANHCTVSPAVSSSGSVTDSPTVTESADVSKSSTSPLSDNPLTDCQPITDSVNSAVLNASSLESDGDAEEKSHSCKELIKGKITCDVELPNRRTSLPLTLTLGDDVTDADSGRDVVRPGEPSEGNSIPSPPPLSAILASASRTKLKRRSRSNSDPTQPITDSMNSSEGNTLKLPQEPNQAAGGLEPNESYQAAAGLEPNESLQSVSNDNSGQENSTSDEDVSTDTQNQSNLSDVSPSSSGDSQNDMSARVEFLKTCFPDVGSDLMNALLTTNNGDVMKVVDELLASGSAEEKTAEDTELAEENVSSSELSHFLNSPSLSAHNTPSDASNEEEQSPPPKVMGEVIDPAGGFNQQRTDSREHGEISSDTPPQENRTSRPRDQPSSQSSTGTFQLTLEPAVALHLIEMFGSFAGVNFQGL